MALNFVDGETFLFLFLTFTEPSVQKGLHPLSIRVAPDILSC